MAKVSAKKPPPENEQKEVQWVKLEKLRLDPLNPRLKEGMENVSQPELLSELATEYEIQELARSIADNGYFSEEPLVAVKDRNRDSWTIVEGNRRLAALQLLENPDAAPRNTRSQWEELSAKRLKRVLSVPILEYADRNEITPYLGFRHITGVMQWRPYQKAKYISQLVEGAGLTFTQIARVIGSKSPTVREHYVAYALVRQARDQMAIDTTFAEGSFGVLRRSLSDPNIREYIGLVLDQTEQQLKRPVARSRAEKVQDFFEWAFGSEDKEPVLPDSRQLRKLGTVLASARAVEVLKSSSDLDYAFEISGGEEKKLVEHLNTASYNLDQALPLSIRHKKSRDVLTALRRCQETFAEILKNFPSLANH